MAWVEWQGTSRQKSLAASGLWCALALLLATAGAAGAQAPSSVWDTTPRQLPLVQPGTVVAERAPSPYTHLIIKSRTRLHPSDRQHVSASTAQMASLVFTTMLAQVRPYDDAGQQRYQLGRVAVGLGTPVGTRHMVLTPDTTSSLAPNLGFMQRMVVSRCYEIQSRSRQVARSPSMAIVDTPALVRRDDGKHVNIVLRYAILVDPQSGRLESLVWQINLDRNGGYAGLGSNIQWLPPSYQMDCVLRVDPDEFTLGVPSDVAFAPETIPQGQSQFAVPAPMRQAVAQQRLSASTASQLQAWLQQIFQTEPQVAIRP